MAIKVKNIRLDTLPADREVAAKDCRNCIKRRIVCDRSIPSCRKCTIRELKCPGFDVFPLKWVFQATNNPKKGFTLHCSHNSKFTKTSSDCPITSSTENVVSQDQSSALTSTHASPISSARLRNLDIQSVIYPSLTSIVGDLLRHFYNEVAYRMTWIDSPHNPWRNIIFPLAQQSKCLQLSILSLSSAHSLATSSSNHDHKKSLVPTSHTLRMMSLRALSHELRQNINQSSMMNTNRSCIEMLASMLVLCYTEMLTPDSTEWCFHLQACRNIIDGKLQDTDDNGSSSPSTALSFLKKEVVDLEIQGTISAFAWSKVQGVDFTQKLRHACRFWAFTAFQYEITFIERQRFHAFQSGDQPPEINMSVWCDKAERTRTQALANLESMEINNSAARGKFGAVIRAHHYAALIYCYQALANPLEAASVMHDLVPLLLGELQSITDGPTNTFSHDISFPMFIAGTEAGAHEYRQNLVQALYVETISATGFNCNYASLNFLHAYWDMKSIQDVGTWIQFARENTDRVSPFLLY